jgi:hypothetical protein
MQKEPRQQAGLRRVPINIVWRDGPEPTQPSALAQQISFLGRRFGFDADLARLVADLAFARGA